MQNQNVTVTDRTEKLPQEIQIRNCNKCGGKFRISPSALLSRNYTCQACEYAKRRARILTDPKKLEAVRASARRRKDLTRSCWDAMIRRCYSPTYSSYKRYGAKGVKVCDRWRQSYVNFVDDVGLRPSKEHSLDRWPNGTGNYEPGNVRWATVTEQQRNRSNNRMVTIHGVTRCLVDWAEVIGISYSALRGRLRLNFSDDDLIKPTIPSRKRRRT